MIIGDVVASPRVRPELKVLTHRSVHLQARLLRDGLPERNVPGQTFNDAGQKSASRKAFVDLPQARFCITSGLPTRTKPLVRRTLRVG